MRTPKEYTDNLKKGIITKAMLVDCLYSSNKRAKNYRDKAREYRSYFRHNRYAYDRYGNVEKAEAKRDSYYAQKEKMLSILTPQCIHEELYGYERRRIYDYEKDFEKYYNNDDFVWCNCFWNHEYDCETWFIDVEFKNPPLNDYRHMKWGIV